MPFLNSLDKTIRNSVFIHEESFFTKADKYIKWAPFFCVAFMGTLKIKMKDRFKNRLIILGLSEGILNSVVEPLKEITKEKRPNFSFSKRSFPSGHTATCFAGAELLREELKDNYPVLSYTGYTMAVSTGILRILNKKHWFSDVIAGAAIGILSSRLSITLYKKIKKTIKNHKSDSQNTAVGQESKTAYQVAL